MTDRKAIFITGGAGGMGLETGRFFAEKGWFVGLYDANEDLLAEAASEFNSDDAVTGCIDVSRESDFVPVVAEFGKCK